MKRREYIAGLGSAAVWPMAGKAQPPAVPAVGVLHEEAPRVAANDFAAGVLPGLAEMGFVEGRNVGAGRYPAGTRKASQLISSQQRDGLDAGTTANSSIATAPRRMEPFY
jgi:hypothetical protein